ncbi:hypothetical protein HRUBRA_00851 [Pseudohaliea rubra DSM 19751]|uniref:Uncharacterized protein n=1 Tax=Pseudohaliea rubra DSM 19751 TaxID=1265313 RepID=A0A095VSS8_9GAMM|nr:hypothetical protein HRUBRA_00851 [Pseudohaliea rubra DSM 19751]
MLAVFLSAHCEAAVKDEELFIAAKVLEGRRFPACRESHYASCCAIFIINTQLLNIDIVPSITVEAFPPG